MAKLSKILKNERGMVLVIAMLILVMLTVLGLGAVMITSTELKISGNLKTSTDALYTAEGGMEITEGNLKTSAVSNFSGSSGTGNNTQIYTIGQSPRTTIMNPLNWVDTTWYVNGSLSTLLSTSNADTAWSICKRVSVGRNSSKITIPRLQWLWSNPKVITFRKVQSQFVSTSEISTTKQIEADIEVKFENNFLSFQTFKNPTSTTTDIDNITNDNVVIGAQGYDLGIDPALSKITGICTNDSTDKAIIIYRDTDNNISTTGWTIVGEAEVNTVNKTFCLSNTHGYRYTSYGGSGEEPVCIPSGGDYIPDTSGAPSLSLSNGQIYKVELVDISSLARSSGNPSSSTSGTWVSNSYNKW